MIARNDGSGVVALVALPPLMVLLAYALDRSESIPLLAMFGAAFVAYLMLVRSAEEVGWKLLLVCAIGVRVLLFLAPVPWTDDHFRYLWDGWCSVNGLQPFAHTPRELLALRPDLFTAAHFDALNSPDFHTVYPPLAQALFATAAFVGDGDMGLATLALRALVLLSELATLFLLRALVSEHARPLRSIAFYAFNPLVLMELTVNLHTEAFMIPLCLAVLLLFTRKRWDAAAVFLALAASVRLWPLLFLLALPALLPLWRSVRFGVITVGLFLLTWLPLYTPDLVDHFVSSAKLFSTYLEFNGGLFELARRLLGDALVKGTGLMGSITVIALFSFAFVRWRMNEGRWSDAMLWLLAIHLFGSQAVHPWYILPLVAFGLLNGWYWPIAWTLLIMPTYLTYGRLPYQQPYTWLLVEYILIAGIIATEIALRGKAKQTSIPTGA